MARIIRTRQLTPVTKLFELDAPLIAASAQPGQFVVLRVREGGERIPVTIADYDRAAGVLTIVVQQVGATTTRLCGLDAGDDLLDVAGPLGSPIEIAAGGHVCGIGGGFGSAALLCLMRMLTSRGDRTTAIVGARTGDRAGLTSRPQVFAGGDAVTGAATVILAAGAGKRAAQAIDVALGAREAEARRPNRRVGPLLSVRPGGTGGRIPARRAGS